VTGRRRRRANRLQVSGVALRRVGATVRQMVAINSTVTWVFPVSLRPSQITHDNGVAGEP
jgi:hypothetical protein